MHVQDSWAAPMTRLSGSAAPRRSPVDNLEFDVGTGGIRGEDAVEIVETFIPGVAMVDSASTAVRKTNEGRLRKRDSDPAIRALQMLFDVRGTIHGLLFSTSPGSPSRLLNVCAGEAFVVAVDVRPTSPAFNEHFALTLNSDDSRAISIPAGVAYGICTLDHSTTVILRSRQQRSRSRDCGVLWVDPDLGIRWPVEPEEAIVAEHLWRYPRHRQLTEHHPKVITLNGYVGLAELATSTNIRSSEMNMTRVHEEPALEWPEPVTRTQR